MILTLINTTVFLAFGLLVVNPRIHIYFCFFLLLLLFWSMKRYCYFLLLSKIIKWKKNCLLLCWFNTSLVNAFAYLLNMVFQYLFIFAKKRFEFRVKRCIRWKYILWSVFQDDFYDFSSFFCVNVFESDDFFYKYLTVLNTNFFLIFSTSKHKLHSRPEAIILVN